MSEHYDRDHFARDDLRASVERRDSLWREHLEGVCDVCLRTKPLVRVGAGLGMCVGDDPECRPPWLVRG